MKKNILLTTIFLIISIFFVSCWCPVGNPWDYEDIEDNSAYYQAPYTLSSGKAYHAEAMLRNNPYGCGNSFVFKAEADVHCQFAVKFYHSKNELEVTINGKEVNNPENGFNVPKDAELKIRVYTKLYLTSGESSAYAEFYLYVD